MNTSTTEIQRLFELQRANKQAVKNTTAYERIQKIKKLKNAVFEHRKKLQDAIYEDFKKPAAEVDLTELFPVISECKKVIRELENWLEPEPVENSLLYFGSSSWVEYEPKGNCLILAPWNYPYQLCLNPLISAVAAGNTVILKPSELVPNASKAIKELLESVFQTHEVAVVEGDASAAAFLLELKFDHIFFTGSPQTGKKVMKAAAEHLTSVTLELGGKSPVIVTSNANIHDAVEKITWGKFLNGGQTCIAPDYLFVEQSVASVFIEKMKTQIASFFTKNPETSESYCSIVNNRHTERILQLIENAESLGAEKICMGNTDVLKRHIAPTILLNVSPDAAILQEEIFGPVLPIVIFDTLESVVSEINKKEKPLSLYIFSKKNKEVDFLLKNTSAGGTCINDVLVHITHPNLPFGGVNNSGIGKTHGFYGFLEFVNQRAVLRQYAPISAAKLAFQPYTDFKKKLAYWTMKYFS